MATGKDKTKTPQKRELRNDSTASTSASSEEELRKKKSVQRSKAKYARAIDALKNK